jgi:HlyD family secretion protein
LQRTSVEQAKVQLESSKTQLKLAQDTLKRQQDLWKDQLTTKQDLDRAENEVRVREREIELRQSEIAMQTTRIRQSTADLDNAKYNLSQVTIDSPIDGIVTKRNIELGETVVIGTMNNAGTVLLTIADMSVIETELEVDETDIPNLKLGQPAKVTIDAIPDKTFTGKVTEIGNSPITAAASTTRATNFKVVVTLDGQIPEVRPGFTCTADITTATREDVLSIPIQATTVRELVYDEKGNIVKEPEADPKKKRPGAKAAVAELKKGQTKKETEGVFLIKDGKALFAPVKTGIAGEKYFEVLSGVKVGDEVITGPFNSVRDLKDGSPVKLEAAKK